MDDETRAAFARLANETRAGFVRMETETRAGFARVETETRAGFARVERWFELSQAQHLELRQDVTGLRQDVTELQQDVSGLRAEFRSFRDWVVAEFANLRALARLTARVERLESKGRV